MQSTVVAHEPGKFYGWPANSGLWTWENGEVLVGFTTGDYVEKPGHNIAEPYRGGLARSKDDGLTWTVQSPTGYVCEAGEPRTLGSKTDFTQTGFAMRVSGAGYHCQGKHPGTFCISTDRGGTWEGPYLLNGLAQEPQLAGLEITSRTEYVVLDTHTCLLFMSARHPHHSDRAFSAVTDDGGKSFRFRSWIVSFDDPWRAVMPSVARGPDGTLAAAVRRRALPADDCWIDAYISQDLAQTWEFAGRIGDTGPGNGNPPALVRLDDSRLCCVFGDRARRCMVARLSADLGASWGTETVIRDDFQPDRFGDPDLGYPQLFQRRDGQLVAMYYWATRELPHQHIAATIWSPG
ncbi:MAG TPA: sialidase family protein [Armatimonadota bacterium]|nr:sialidase family protein [Armatimonadota bacterium]